MGRGRDKATTRWSHLDCLQDGRLKLRRHSGHSPALGPRFKKLQAEVLQQKLLSELRCVEELQEVPDDFTKIR